MKTRLWKRLISLAAGTAFFCAAAAAGSWLTAAPVSADELLGEENDLADDGGDVFLDDGMVVVEGNYSEDGEEIYDISYEEEGQDPEDYSMEDVYVEENSNENSNITIDETVTNITVNGEVPLPDGLDILYDNGQGLDGGMISDGMEPGPTAADFQTQAIARAMSFLGGPYTQIEPADPERIRQFLDELMKMESPTGSDGELEIGQYIIDTMYEFGYNVSQQDFHEGFLNDDLIDVPGMNILAEMQVNTEEPTDDIILVITHYDSRYTPGAGQLGDAWSEYEAADAASTVSEEMSEPSAAENSDASAAANQEPSAAEEENDTEAEPGTDLLANDKSGVAVALETARLVSGLETGIDICFVFLSGEEDGYYGSASFLEAIEPFLEHVVAVVGIGPSGYLEEAYAPYTVATPDGEENRPAALMLTSAAVQKLAMLSENTDSLDGAEGVPGVFGDGIEEADNGNNEDPALENAQDASGADDPESERIKSDLTRFDWELKTDEQSSCSAFSEAGLETIFLQQEISDGTKLTGPNVTGLAETADIVARLVGMYTAGIR